MMSSITLPPASSRGVSYRAPQRSPHRPPHRTPHRTPHRPPHRPPHRSKLLLPNGSFGELLRFFQRVGLMPLGAVRQPPAERRGLGKRSSAVEEIALTSLAIRGRRTFAFELTPLSAHGCFPC